MTSYGKSSNSFVKMGASGSGSIGSSGKGLVASNNSIFGIAASLYGVDIIESRGWHNNVPVVIHSPSLFVAWHI